MACSATARSLTPCPLASRTPRGLEQRAVVLVGAGAQRLHEAQAGRAVQQVIAPQAGDDEHVRLADARFQLLERAHLEAAQAGVSRGESVLHAIGDMREADGDVGAAGQGGNGHAGSPSARPGLGADGGVILA